MTANEYLERVEEQIRQKNIYPEIRAELLNHIVEQAEYWQEEGMPREEAFRKAVADMGDPVETGVQLDQVHQPRLDWKFFLFCFSILTATILIQIAYLVSEPMEPEKIVTIWKMMGMITIVIVMMQKYELLKVFQIPYMWWVMFAVIATVSTLFGYFNGFEKGDFFVKILADKAVCEGAITGMLMPFGGVVYRCRNSSRKRMQMTVLMAVYGCVLSVLIQSLYFTAFLATAYGVLLTLGIRRGYFSFAGKKRLLWIWAVPAILLFSGVLKALYTFDGQHMISAIQNYFTVYPDMPVVLKSLFGGKWGMAGTVVWFALQLVFLLRMFTDIRRLTNQFCNLMCTGVLLGYVISMVYSILCILGFGEMGEVRFSIFSAEWQLSGIGVYYYCIYLGVFMYFQRRDRATPTKGNR